MTQSIAAPAPEPGKPKLLDQVCERCRLRHQALSTEHAYVGWIRRFILFHQNRHPLEMGANEVSGFLTNLAVAGHVAASTQNQALSAMLFLYREVLEKDFGWLNDVVRANKPKRLPTVFTPEEAAAIIKNYLAYDG
jgi:site-specific recombinase XerD